MKITVSATGHLKQYVKKQVLEVEDGITVGELKTICNIPANTSSGFIVNGQVKRAADTLADGDKVTFIMIVGAG